MAETKKTAVVKPAAKAVAAKAAEVKEETKTEEVKEAPKAETKKSAAKKTAKKETKKETKKAATEKTTKTRAKKAAEAEVVIQNAGNDYTTEKLVSIAKDVWQYDLNRKPADFKTVKLYVKMEEQLVYYVINDEVSGSFGI
ncbi:MAG: hypothetical protein K2N85_14690 [Lachnospiraceae bacterium]|nr:hypothetical protein [Lachnospiraceae bacterium]